MPASRAPYTNTLPHRILKALLTYAGFEWIAEKSVVPYSLDCFVESHALAFEADGMYFHERTEKLRPGYYAARDAYVSKKLECHVIRLTDRELFEINRILQLIPVAQLDRATVS